ncbi:MAG: M14 family metallopeptidase, partial [Spirochaetales bacterium]|nr:M14 family metallopeptidase [Spirochaetales bacterium]
TLHVIENMNPDGLYRITGGADPAAFDFRAVDTVPGRFNARGVDLNRNWDGQWRPVSYWRGREVDAGDEPFSEPETRAVRDYFLRVDPTASVFFQSAAAFLWYSGAEEGWDASLQLARAYSAGSGYRVLQPRGGDDDDDFDITGSADDYFYTIGHRNVTVELTTHYEIEWERNLAGVRSLLGALRRERR